MSGSPTPCTQNKTGGGMEAPIPEQGSGWPPDHLQNPAISLPPFFCLWFALSFYYAGKKHERADVEGIGHEGDSPARSLLATARPIFFFTKKKDTKPITPTKNLHHNTDFAFACRAPDVSLPPQDSLSSRAGAAHFLVFGSSH